MLARSALGVVLITGDEPTETWGRWQGIAYEPLTDAMATIDAADATFRAIGGMLLSPLGQLYVVESDDAVAPLFGVAGFTFDANGAMVVSFEEPALTDPYIPPGVRILEDGGALAIEV